MTLRVGLDVDLDAAVQLAAAGRAVGRARLGLAVADRVDARAANAEVLEVVRDRRGSTLGEPLVIRVRADRVRVTLDANRRVGILLEHVGHLPQ